MLFHIRNQHGSQVLSDGFQDLSQSLFVLPGRALPHALPHQVWSCETSPNPELTCSLTLGDTGAPTLLLAHSHSSFRKHPPPTFPSSIEHSLTQQEDPVPHPASSASCGDGDPWCSLTSLPDPPHHWAFQNQGWWFIHLEVPTPQMMHLGCAYWIYAE